MKKATKRAQLILLGLCFLILGCAPTVDVNTDYAQDANFSQYQTFSFYQEQPTEAKATSGNYDTMLDQRLKTAIRQSLSTQGLTYDASSPDLKVAYDVAVDTETEVNTNYAYPRGFGYGYSHWYGYRYNYGFNRFPATYKTINQYKQGTIVVDLVDVDSNELVWRGVGEAPVDMAGDISQERINTIVSNILKQYPPTGN
ncbi:hypothetical protein ABID22_001029 [Pontibacter aydingkolensis]|uniref:DUF4136 domain-containing protein n=1 Tax=Pontibacter aydingkolensis TaxID=1911536 RepID=A0ABS7CSY5_9BACT|nr:DUF4136 domain-containing protein [Pontibacter aydingkolensis]MBW7466939.1 DUF4136 domain-containing protein [Pontibacter aydingkolensis]